MKTALLSSVFTLRRTILSGFFLLLACLTMVPVVQPDSAAAASCEEFKCDDDDLDSEERQSCYNQQIACLQGALSGVRKQQTTLTGAINVLNGEINLQQVQINQLRAEITRLEKDIDELSERISGLNVSLDRLSTMLIDRIRAQYKRAQQSPITVLFSSESFGTFVSKYKYLSEAGHQTAFAMTKAETQRLEYDEQKALKEAKQAQVLDKRAELEGKNLELASKRQEQQALLSATKNDESRYQQLLQEAEKELAQIAAAAEVVIRQGNGVDVERGEVVGTMGNSGYSTGAHLHFGVYKYDVKEFQSNSSWGWYNRNYVDPLDKLKSKTVTWSTGCGHDPSGSTSSGKGSWDWPMSSPRITQNYGSNTCYNWMYGGKAHPAIDMVGIGSIDVKAVDDGEAYFCRNCLGDGGNGVFIFHDGDYMTLYWHLK
jgi:peptidoglycan hydrolase CwlO-like protein